MKSTTKRINELEQLIKSLMLEIHNNINYSVKNISHLENDVEYLKSLMKIETLNEKNIIADKLIDVLRDFSYQYSKCQIAGSLVRPYQILWRHEGRFQYIDYNNSTLPF